MRNLFIIILVSLFVSNINAQKIYSLKKKNKTEISAIVKAKYEDLNDAEKKLIESKFPSKGDSLNISFEEIISGKKTTIYKSLEINDVFLKNQTLDKIEKYDWTESKNRERFYVKLDEKGKLWFKEYVPIGWFGNWNFLQSSKKRLEKINLRKEEQKQKSKSYFKQLENGEVIELQFSEVKLQTVTIPFKFRFGGRNDELDATANINIMGSMIFGQTAFGYFKGTGNIEKTWQIMVGPLIGLSSVSLDQENTILVEGDSRAQMLPVSKGVFTVGFGVGSSIDNITIGAFGGWDSAIGNDAEIWEYQKDFWVGLGLGISLFKF